MQACGCGFLALVFSNNSFTAIVPLNLAEKLTPTAIILGIYQRAECEIKVMLNIYLFRKYLPVLKNMPVQYIHEPWTAPEHVQRAAKCVIGKDYSLPMVNHSLATRINIQRMKQVYQQLSNYRSLDNSANFKEGYQAQPNIVTVGNLNRK
jgi:hypothetical protein